MRALLAVSALVYGGWAAHNGLLLPWEIHHVGAAVREPALVAVRAAFWLFPVLFYLRLHDPRPRLVALGVTSPLNWRGLAWSGVGGLVYLCLISLLLGATASAARHTSLFATLAGAHALYMFSSVALEELLLRGFLLGQLVRVTTAFRSQAGVALLFALMHLPGWLALQGPSMELIPSLVTLTVLGAVLGGVARGSNSILPAIALHFANNVMAEMLGGG